MASREDKQYGHTRALDVEIYNRHASNVAERSCGDHDAVGCKLCMAEDHGTAKEFQECLQDKQKQLQNLVDQYMASKAKLDQNMQQKLDKVPALKMELDKKIKATENAIEDAYDNLNKEITRGIETLEKSNECIEQSSDDLHKLSVATKMQARLLASAKEKLGEVYLQDVTDGLIFKNIGSINVKLDGESVPCNIYSMCVTENDFLVISDQSTNESIKVVNLQTRSVVSHFCLTSDPWGLCQMIHNDVAVCLPHERQLQILRVDDSSVSPIKTIQLDFECRCVAKDNNTLYINDHARIYICDMDGKILRVIKNSSDGEAEFSNIYVMAFNNVSRLLYVGCESKEGTFVIDTSGNVVNCIPKITLMWPTGICNAVKETVFVSDCQHKKIIQLNENGDIVGSVLEDMPERPQAIYFDQTSGCLFVAMFQRNELNVYETE